MDNFTPLTAPAKKKKKFNKLLIFGNLFLVVIMAIGGYFYYNNVLLTKEQKAEISGLPPPWTGSCPDGGTPNDVAEQCPGGGYVDEIQCTYSDGTPDKWFTKGTTHCGASASGWLACVPWPGTSMSCGPYNIPEAILDVGGPSTSGIGTCNQYTPSLWAGPGGNCQINCLCCPPGTHYTCTTSSNTYEYATTERRKYVCQNNNHADKYVSSRPNPAYNSAIPPEDNPLCTEETRANGNIVWKCLDTLTTCMQSVCSCQGQTQPTATPTPAGCNFTGCSTDHPGYRYTYQPACPSTCSLGCADIWPIWPGNYTLDSSCSASPTPTRTPTPTPTGVISSTPTPTATPTSTPTATPVISNTPTATPVISNTPTSTPIATNTPTSTPVLTNTPGPSATPTEIILAKVSPSATPTTATQLLQTGVIKSFLYWVPAIIILVGLIL